MLKFLFVPFVISLALTASSLGVKDYEQALVSAVKGDTVMNLSNVGESDATVDENSMGENDLVTYFYDETTNQLMQLYVVDSDNFGYIIWDSDSTANDSVVVIDGSVSD